MVGIFPSTLTLVPICIKCLLDDGFDIVVDIDKLFTYDIYLVIYPMPCLPVSKIFTNERAGHSRSYVNLSV